MSKARETAQEFLNLCREWGWTPSVRGSILEITKTFTPGDNSGFCTADMEYGSLLDLIPRTSAGSTWGTDGGGMGALTAMRTGVFRMKMSGGSKRVLRAIEQLVA